MKATRSLQDLMEAKELAFETPTGCYATCPWCGFSLVKKVKKTDMFCKTNCKNEFNKEVKKLQKDMSK